MNIPVQRFQATDFNENFGDVTAIANRDERIRQAYQRGYDEGAASATALAQERLSAGAEAVEQALSVARAEGEMRWLRMEAEAAECAVIIARKLSAALISPESLVAETMRAAIASFATPPQLTVSVHPALAEVIRDRCENAQPADDRILVEPDPSLAEADCRIVWSGGSIRRDSAGLDAMIEQLVARAFPAAPNPAEETSL